MILTWALLAIVAALALALGSLFLFGCIVQAINSVFDKLKETFHG